MGKVNYGKIVAISNVQPPFSFPCIFEKDYSYENCRLGGINFDIFRILMMLLGFDFELKRADEGTTGYKDKNGTWHGALGQLARGKANMTAYLIAVKSQRLEVVDFSVPVESFMLGFLIKTPQNPNVFEIPLKFLFSPFAPSQWMMLLASVILIAVFVILARRLLAGSFEFTDSVFHIVRSVVSQPSFQLYFGSLRILFSLFQIALFFVVAFYSARLTSSLLVSTRAPNPFDNFHDYVQKIYDKEFTIITDTEPDNPRYQPITDQIDSDNPYIKLKIAYQWNTPVFVPGNRYDLIVDKIKNNGSLVYYGSYERLLSMASNSCDVKAVKDQGSNPSWLSFAFAKGSPLQEIITDALSQESTSIEAYHTRLQKRYLNSRDCTSAYSTFSSPAAYRPFRLHEMQGPFFVLLNGFGIAVLGILLEKIYRLFKRISEKNSVYSSETVVEQNNVNAGLETEFAYSVTDIKLEETVNQDSVDVESNETPSSSTATLKKSSTAQVWSLRQKKRLKTTVSSCRRLARKITNK